MEQCAACAVVLSALLLCDISTLVSVHPCPSPSEWTLRVVACAAVSTRPMSRLTYLVDGASWDISRLVVARFKSAYLCGLEVLKHTKEVSPRSSEEMEEPIPDHVINCPFCSRSGSRCAVLFWSPSWSCMQETPPPPTAKHARLPTVTMLKGGLKICKAFNDSRGSAARTPAPGSSRGLGPNPCADPCPAAGNQVRPQQRHAEVPIKLWQGCSDRGSVMV